MLQKLGLVLLVVIFGLLMFAAGMAAPAGLREAAARAWTRFAATSSAFARSAESAVASDLQMVDAALPKGGPAVPGSPGVGLAGAVGAAKAGTASAGSAAAASADAVPLRSLLLPVPLPAKGQYGLQVGPFADAAAALAVCDRAAASNVPCALLTTVDSRGARTTVAAVGSYSLPEDARNASGWLASRLSIGAEQPVILLPPPKP